MIVKTKIDMDLDRACPVRNVYAVQGDTNTRVLELSLYVNKIPWQIPPDAFAQVRYGRDDRTGGVYDTLPDGTRAWEIADNRVSVTLAPQVLAGEGQADVQVELLRDGGSLATFSVCVQVEKNPALGAVSPPAYFNLHQWLLEQLDSLELPSGSAEISVGTVATLTPGQNAWASVTREGDSSVLNLGIPAGYNPVKGVDYWTEAERQEMLAVLNKALTEGLEEAAADLAQIGPEFAESIGECADTGKVYVLPDGYLYAYMTRETYADPPELYDPAAATLNMRHSGTPGTVIASNGYVLTDCIQVDMTARDPVQLRILSDGVSVSSDQKPKFWKIVYYDRQNNCLGNKYMYAEAGSTAGVKLESSGDTVTIFAGYSGTGQKESYYDQIAAVRFEVQTANTPAVDSDRNLIRSIIDPNGGGAAVETGWLNTGHAFVPADYEERILTLEETAREHALRLDAAQSVEGADIPDYWQGHLMEKTAAVQALQEAGGRDCFSFAVLADIHECANLGRRSGALARYLMDNCDIRYALVLGDTVTRASMKTESDLLESYDWAEEILQPIRDRALQTRGNHEGSWGDNGSRYYLHDLPPEKLHSRIWRKVGMIPGITTDDTGTAFYVDDAANRVRYILLNSHYLPYAENADGTPQYSTFRNARIGQSQFDWLSREALRVKEGWAIIVGTHVPLNEDYDAYYGGERGDGAVLRGLLEAYNDRDGYYFDAPGTLGVDAVHLEVNFEDAAGEVIAAVAGHSHIDSAGRWGIQVITTRCDGAEDVTDADRAARVRGTITEQSFDIFTVNRKTRTIHATKIGAGEDRVIPY